MEIKNIIKLIKNSYKSAILFGLFLGAISFLMFVTFQKSFRSSTDLLIVQNQPGTTDFYTLSRSSEYLSNVITESIYSEKFLNEVASSKLVHSDFVSEDKIQRLKDWQKIVNIKKNSNAGILNITVFGDSQTEALQISNGVLDVLINKNNLFLGKDQTLEIRILSGPIVEKNPSFSKVIIVSSGGFLLGLFLIFLFAIYREEFFKNYEEKFSSDLLSNAHRENNEDIYSAENVTSLEENEPDYLSENSDYWKKKLETLE